MTYLKVPFSADGVIPSADEVRKSIQMDVKEFSISSDFGYPCVEFSDSVSSEIVEKVFQHLKNAGFKVY